jgi:hypothetical protein
MDAPLDLPPAFDGHPVLYMATVFSLLLVMLLALEWLWRITWSFFERPAPVKAPVTVLRVIFLLLLVGAVVRSGPDLWLIMRWPQLDGAERIALMDFDNRMDAGAFIFLSLAWLVGRLGEPMLTYQLEKRPLPVHLWPTWEQMKRPLKIGMGVFAIAFALTYLR